MTLSVIEPGCRTPPHHVRDDGSREPCPTCDYQPLALARVVRRSWWRRLLAWRPWAPAALAPSSPDLDLALDASPCTFELVAFDEFGVPLWRASDGTSAAAPLPNASRPPPVPRSLPSDGMPCAR